MAKRIYVVTNTRDAECYLVKADNRVQARNAMAKDMFDVELASQDDLVKLVSNGVEVVEAGEADDTQGSLTDVG